MATPGFFRAAGSVDEAGDGRRMDVEIFEMGEFGRS
jgi:hypothetical protein